MLAPKLTAKPVAKPTLRARRPPDEYIDLLSRSEKEFLEFVQQLEQHPLFNELIQQGVVSRVRFRGRLPRDKYEEYMDREFFRFLETYKITDVPDWDKDFLSDNALNRVPELARKYQVPAGTLTRFLRYLRSTSREGGHSLVAQAASAYQQDVHAADISSQEAFPDPADLVASKSRVDLSTVIAITQEFVEKYGLTEQDFINDILSGEVAAEEISAKYGCSVREAEEVLSAAGEISFVESYESAIETPSSGSTGAGASSSGESPVAYVSVNDDGSYCLEFDGDSVYVQRYRIRPKCLEESGLLAQYPELRELIDRARFINQRMSVLSRVICAVCERQKNFLLTGDPLQLRPLSQADIARDLKEHQSTISRIIRGKTIGTPHGIFPLTYLCQSKTDVIARLVQAYPDKPDIQIRDILLHEYGCKIARRTVAYHRGKRARRKASREKKRKPS